MTTLCYVRDGKLFPIARMPGDYDPRDVTVDTHKLPRQRQTPQEATQTAWEHNRAIEALNVAAERLELAGLDDLAREARNLRARAILRS